MSKRRTVATKSEQALLALALQDPSVVDEAGSVGLTAEDFGGRRARAFWRGMIKDRQAGIGPDEATILERHESDLGPGKPFIDLESLSKSVDKIKLTRARRSNLDAYIETIKEYRVRRELIASAQEVLALHEEGGDTADMRSRAERSLLDVQARATGSGPVLAADLFQTAQGRAERIRAGTEVDNQLFTGIRALDKILRWAPGEYALVAARPSMGKTQFAFGALAGIAKRHGPCQFQSVEQGADSLGGRIYKSSISGSGSLDERELRAGQKWENLPLWVDPHARTLSEVLSSIRIARARHGIVAFAIDYLQLMKLPRGPGESREEVVANASAEIKYLCKSTGLFGMVLCQLNRGVDNRPDKRPKMADLRESGALEQDADSILFIYRDAYYNPTTKEPNKVELIIGKQREGPAGLTVPATFVPGQGWFRDYEPERGEHWSHDAD